ncbi:MAG: hypothetical protein LBV74_01150 [Tannerella sp.]|jgi:hypothetical protein|nr:hypothetical protein [Tannerella sp.]
MWQKIFFNVQNIQAETASACLIKMPNRSEYIGYSFWHPKKLVREQGCKGYSYTFSFTEDFVFRLKKYRHGKHNRIDVISETEIGFNEMMEAFGVTNENVKFAVESETDRLYAQTIEETIVEKHNPDIKEKVISNELNELRKWNQE